GSSHAASHSKVALATESVAEIESRPSADGIAAAVGSRAAVRRHAERPLLHVYGARIRELGPTLPERRAQVEHAGAGLVQRALVVEDRSAARAAGSEERIGAGRLV